MRVDRIDKPYRSNKHVYVEIINTKMRLDIEQNVPIILLIAKVKPLRVISSIICARLSYIYYPVSLFPLSGGTYNIISKNIYLFIVLITCKSGILFLKK